MAISLAGFGNSHSRPKKGHGFTHVSFFVFVGLSHRGKKEFIRREGGIGKSRGYGGPKVVKI